MRTGLGTFGTGMRRLPNGISYLSDLSGNTMLGFGSAALANLPSRVDTVAGYQPTGDVSQDAAKVSSLGSLGRLVGYGSALIVPSRIIAECLERLSCDTGVLYDESGVRPSCSDALFASSDIGFHHETLVMHIEPTSYPTLEQMFLGFEATELSRSVERALYVLDLHLAVPTLHKIVSLLSCGKEDPAIVKRLMSSAEQERSASGDVFPMKFHPHPGSLGQGAFGMAERVSAVGKIWQSGFETCGMREMVAGKVRSIDELESVARGCGIADMVCAYYEGVPLEDVLA